MFLQRSLIGASLILGLLSFVPKTELAAQSVNNVAAAPVNTQAETIRSRNEQTIRRYFELLSQKRMDEWLKLWAEDGVQDMPYSPKGFPKRVEGKAAVTKHYSALPTSVGRMVFPDLKIYPTTDPNTFFVEFRGEIEVLATKKPYNNTYAGLFKFRDGKVALFREYFDPIVFTEAWGSPSGFN
ncbi:hypothetical protein DSM106972_015000 [Dulcicalothrix desertica PCC 7102]|uniref:SnoaL-like domain-containing protein n=1 Tax=Dulcicalothrix desertica PCC 7102 TaxID=232991 RepID=A0A3S1ASJ7_9CYAN|nr:nuclear transport factor 2 family protein [Dulcicalothrix desertica]RUT08332.1 hypothetical protein DSM106972_015000 [Dulcicalothrix desertica PCC 7102]TWH40197.1 hypothetical protein CAL7102_09501 [Dulcicalothrix desertica PCC 7102]